MLKTLSHLCVCVYRWLDTAAKTRFYLLFQELDPVHPASSVSVTSSQLCVCVQRMDMMFKCVCVCVL